MFQTLIVNNKKTRGYKHKWQPTLQWIKKKQNKKKIDSYKRDVLPSPSVDLTGGVATVALGGGGSSCLATLAHLAPHHHLPGHTADLTVGHGTGGAHPDEARDRDKNMYD